MPEVIDVWFDSGAMPFAQHHFPFENEQLFEDRFPADFICEAQDQTRGWFYSLLAVATLTAISGGDAREPAPYRNVVCLGLILDEEGQKMSKSRGNTVEPWQVLDTYGADAFRWYFFSSKQPWDGYRFSTETIGEGVRLFLKQLWSTYYFYVLYAQARGRAAWRERGPRRRSTDLDRWALSRTEARREFVTERLDAYDATGAGRAIAELVDELSNWYVRRSRAALLGGRRRQRSRRCARACWRWPSCWRRSARSSRMRSTTTSTATLASVHLCDFPRAGEIQERDERLESAMALARETVRLGLGARGKAKIKVRQPLAEAVVVADGSEREARSNAWRTSCARELNVRDVRFVAAADELGSYEVKANYRTLGPRFGKRHAAGGGGDRGARSCACRDGRPRRRRDRYLRWAGASTR